MQTERKKKKKKKQNHLVINVAVKKVIHCATSTPEEDGSTSEECQHFEIRQLPWHRRYGDRPAKQRSESVFNTDDITCYGFSSVQERKQRMHSRLPQDHWTNLSFR